MPAGPHERHAMNDQEIPTLIREIRHRAGLTQEKCAARLGVTFPTINRWENGHSRPSPLALRQIAGLVRELGDRAADLASRFEGSLDAP